MSDPVFLGELSDPLPEVGARVELTGDEGHHAAVVRRITVGEVVVIADGRGRGVRGEVIAANKRGLAVEVAAQLSAPEPQLRITAVQALAKGDRGELAVELMTEAGVHRVVPWSAQRSMLRWTGERAQKSLRRWRSTAREAAKQSRRLRVPEVTDAVDTNGLLALVGNAGRAFVLHEEVTDSLSARDLAGMSGEVLIIVGPEGGIDPAELDQLVSAGAEPVLVSDGVLRTSTAGVVAIAQLQALAPVEPVETTSVEPSPTSVEPVETRGLDKLDRREGLDKLDRRGGVEDQG